MHICISKLSIISSNNGLSPGWRQAIIWTNAGMLLIGPLGTNFSEILIKIYAFSFKKMHLKMSGKWQPFCNSLNGLMSSKYDLWSTFATARLQQISCSIIGNSVLTHLLLNKMADDIFKYIFVNEKFYILINTSLKFVPKGQINNIPALVQIMAWCQVGDKPLSEPMVT